MKSSKDRFYSDPDALPHLQDLQDFIESGQTDNIPPQIQRYLNMLRDANNMYNMYKSNAFILRTLMITYEIKETRARQILQDALNFFNSDTTVTKAAWRNIYAKKLEDVALLALQRDEIETYRRIIMSICEIRGLDKDDPPPAQLASTRITVYTLNPSDVGISKVDRRDLSREIERLQLPEDQERQIKMDAGIGPRKLFEDRKFKDGKSTTEES
jgi:hypothetical protein